MVKSIITYQLNLSLHAQCCGQTQTYWPVPDALRVIHVRLERPKKTKQL